MKLSICMMVKDEEKNLRRCLDKLKPLVEAGLAELIIVDTGSTDNTEVIAREYTDKVYFHKWSKNFSQMRNISISYAKGEWIFIIDADERLDDFEKLIVLMNTKEIDEYNTIILKIKNLYSEKDENKYNLIASPRIFRNDGSFKYEGAVHNQPIFKQPTLNTDISVTHFGYISTDKKLMEKKYKRTGELLKSELKKDPKNLYYIYQLAITYDMHGEHEKSLDELRKAYNILKTKNFKERGFYTYIYASYARIAYENNKYKESIKSAKEGLTFRKDYIDLYYLAGLSEKMLFDEKAAYNYLTKYTKLAEKYREMNIVNDLSIIMYHVDDDSKSNAYYEICRYYLNNNEYEKAYEVYNKVTNANQKIYLSINILAELMKYSELREVYNDLRDQKKKDTFLYTLEKKINKLQEKNKVELYREFSLNEDNYGILNRIRLSSNVKDKFNLAKTLVEQLNFNEASVFYSEVFIYIKEDIKLIIKIFKNIETCNLRNIVKQLIEKNGFAELFENYVLQSDIDTMDVEELKVIICIATMLMAIYIKDNNDVNERYLNIFKLYIKAGVNFISQLYQINNAKMIYKSVNNYEDRFFIVMYMVNKCIECNDKKSAVKYMMEAVNLNKAFSKYIDVYKDELFDLKQMNTVKKEKEEFEKYKLKVKENIRGLINNGNIEEAKNLISEYEQIVKQDIDICSMKAVILIMENKLDEAEKVLREGLKLDPKNKDLLYNLSYLMNEKNNNTKALEFYSRAKLFNPDNNIKIESIIPNLNPIDNNKLRVLHGTMEIANQMNTITGSLKKLGVEAHTLNYYPSYLGYKSDYNLNLSSFGNINKADIETKKLASKMIAENDVFHFHFGTSLTLDYSDLHLLKELNKKVIMQYWGSDVRMYSKAIKLNKYVKVKDMNEDSIKRKLEFISKYIPDCLVDYELAEYVKEYHSNIHYTRAAVDLNKYKFIKETNNKKFLIVHAPTSPEYKGTNYILKAVNELKEKYDFDFKLVKGMSHKEAVKIYEKADLIIDQILIGSYGLFAIETMAMGKPVICWIDDFMKEKYPRELPIISANPDNIKEKIEYIIKNKDMVEEIGIQSRKYVEKYHDVNIISKNMLQIYKSL